MPSASPNPASFPTPLHLTLTAPVPVEAPDFKMGTAHAPDGRTLTLDACSLRLNGRRWTPVMGEFHYSRYPATDWAGELAKMRAGAVDIVASYVFWIHHEEIATRWEWDGDKDLQRFVKLAAAAGLKVIVRCGPWCHGEVRNGGLPDWLLAKGAKVRTDDPAYLDDVRRLYAQIADQLRGLLWKDGGPVIGIQIENEYPGPAEHLLTLKQIAQSAGLDVPLYTRTGWPALATPLPFGEFIPLYGVYAEGFWDRETTAMPGLYWSGFHFSTQRTDANIANEALGRRDAIDDPEVARYPYLTCEIGGGMMSSYHRRIRIDPRDIEATTLVKLGSGSNSPGYYMYHGGINPPGHLTTLMEAQDTAFTNWNDLPVKNYDFQAPLGACGQVRPHYRLLRRLHHFLHDFDTQFAATGTVLPALRPSGKDDATTLRWAVRTDGERGFLFVNNHERGRSLPTKPKVQFQLTTQAGADLLLPTQPVAVPADSCFFWPFNLDLGRDARLVWATAQPVAHSAGADGDTFYFAVIPGIPAEFVITGAYSISGCGRIESLDADRLLVRSIAAGREAVITVNYSVRLVLLDVASSLALARDPATGAFEFEPPEHEACTPLTFTKIKSAGPARKIMPGNAPKPASAAPQDIDFVDAAIWVVDLPVDFDPATSPARLRVHYTGDVARVYAGRQLVMDDFYHGEPLEFSLRSQADALRAGDLTVAILPLQHDAVADTPAKIFLAESDRPEFADRHLIAEIRAIELVSSNPMSRLESPV